MIKKEQQRKSEKLNRPYPSRVRLRQTQKCALFNLATCSPFYTLNLHRMLLLVVCWLSFFYFRFLVLILTLVRVYDHLQFSIRACWVVKFTYVAFWLKKEWSSEVLLIILTPSKISIGYAVVLRMRGNVENGDKLTLDHFWAPLPKSRE